MAIHSGILAWEIPRAEESGGLQSMEGTDISTSKLSPCKQLERQTKVHFLNTRSLVSQDGLGISLKRMCLCAESKAT